MIKLIIIAITLSLHLSAFEKIECYETNNLSTNKEIGTIISFEYDSRNLIEVDQDNGVQIQYEWEYAYKAKVTIKRFHKFGDATQVEFWGRVQTEDVNLALTDDLKSRVSLHLYMDELGEYYENDLSLKNNKGEIEVIKVNCFYF